MTRIGRRGLALASGTLALPPRARAQDWPSRPIRLVVPHAAGGGNDAIARLLADWLRPILPQPVVVENRTGANGVVGAEVVARGDADGHLLLVVARTHAMNRHAMGSLPFHPVRDFAPVTLIARFPLVLTANAGQPFRDLPALIAHARAHPGQLGSGISEPFVHYASALFARMAGIQWVEVPYRGSALILNDLLAGHIPLGWVSPLSVVPHLASGRLRPLAVTTTRRIGLLPDVPTMAEAGLAGYEAAGLYGILGPAALPGALADRLHAAITQAVSQPDRRTRLESLGLEIVLDGPAPFRAFLDRDDALWAEAARGGLVPRGH